MSSDRVYVDRELLMVVHAALDEFVSEFETQEEYGTCCFNRAFYLAMSDVSKRLSLAIGGLND